MTWNNVYPIVASDPLVRYHWTKAIIQNELYLYRQDLDNILKLNTSIPGAPAFTELTPLVSEGNPVNMAGIQGIFNARGRLGLWDIENSIYWSSLDDAEDFEAQAETGANLVQVDGLVGRIVDIRSTDDGFVVYSTGNIISAVFDVDQIFRFEELTSAVGIFTPDHLCVGHNGEHIILGNGDFYIINARRDPGKPLVQNIFPEVSDYIKKYKGHPRISFHGNRYFAIALQERDSDSSTIIERNQFEIPGFYDPGYVDTWRNIFLGWGLDFWIDETTNPIPDDYITPMALVDSCPTYTLTPPEDYHPIEYPAPFDTGEVPSRGYKGKLLWGMRLEHRPGIDLEPMEDEDFQLLFSSASNKHLFATVSEYSAIGITADTFDEYRNFWRGSNWLFTSSKRTLSFNPFRLLSMQMELYKARTRKFYNGASNFGDYNLIAEGYSWDKLSESAAITTVIIGNSTGDPPVYIPQKTETEETLEIVNIRERDKGVNRVRESYTWTFEKTIVHIFHNTAKLDYELVTTTAEAIQPNAMFGLSKVYDTRVMDDTFFKGNACFDSDIFMRNRVGSLGNPYPFSESPTVDPNTDKELFGTQANIAGKTDYQNFATIGSFVGRRAFVTENDRVMRIYEKHELKENDPEDPDQGYYYLLHRIESSDTRTFDRLVFESTTPSPPGYSDLGLTQVPRRTRNLATPVWFIYNDINADPEPLLPAYWAEALANYPTMEDKLAIKQVYEDHGWKVETFIPTVNIDESHYQMPVADASPDTFNDTPNAGIFGTLDLIGSLCEEPMSTVPVVNFDEDITIYNTSGRIETPDVVVEDGFSLDPWSVTGPQLVELTGQAGLLDAYPIYSSTLWFDWLLQKWGISNNPIRYNIDYRPLNRIAYDPMTGTSISHYSYQNYLKSLGAVGILGELIVWDKNPRWSFAVFGKLGFKRRGQTRMVEATFEFLDRPNCIVGIEAALDASGVNPFTTQAKYAVKKFERLRCDSVGVYHNAFVFGGRYEIIQIEYIGHRAGEL